MMHSHTFGTSRQNMALTENPTWRSSTELVCSVERKQQTQTIGFYYIYAYASRSTSKLAGRLAICGCAAVRCVERSDDAGTAGRAPAETYSSYAAERRCTRRASARQLTRLWTAAAARTMLLLAASTMSGIPHVVDIILGLELASRQPTVAALGVV